MYDYLIDHALRTVWCAPRQDTQSIVKPARLTPPKGAWNQFRVMWRTYRLPERKVRFHIYQIGQLHPLLMGLFPEQQRWITFAECCNTQAMIVDLYTTTGVQLPRSDSWYMVTEDKNLIVAVKEQLSIEVDLEVDPLYIRVYTNANFNAMRTGVVIPVDGTPVSPTHPMRNGVYVKGGLMRVVDDILSIQTEYQSYTQKPGHTYVFVNGYRVETIDLITTKIGDYVEFVYDSSIYKVLDFQLKDLRMFDSLLDLKAKYLLHYPGAGDNTIDYHDDIDVFVLNPGKAGRFKGVYFHRNLPDALRMVTHKDYAISIPNLMATAADHPEWDDPLKLVVRLQIRKGGWIRPLQFDNNRIFELYKLQDEYVRKALLGLDSNVDVWRADRLEASAYTELMRLPEMYNATKKLTESAFGYNAISKLVADTPKFPRIESNQAIIDVPYGLTIRSTGFEYDVNGELLTWHVHNGGSIYPVRDNHARLVEQLNGITDDQPDDEYGRKTTVLDPKASYRMYTCDIIDGVSQENWQDVTGSAKYAIINNTLTWLTDPKTVGTLVRGDRKVLAYDLSASVFDGHLEFIMTARTRRNDIIGIRPMTVPMGQLDLFLNGRSLIEGLDYFVEFPRVVVVNKEYLVSPETQEQRITVRWSGFCDKNLEWEKPTDVGFVKYGLLSRNNRFDLRDDKVLRITVDGQLYHRSELKFSENDSGVTVLDARNGAPYAIRDIVVPMIGLTEDDTYVLRERSRVIDRAVSDYMTLKVPDPVIDGVFTIEERYSTYSPFCSKLIMDLSHGWLDDPRIKQQYGEELVDELTKPYQYLLKFDPTQDARLPDDSYVTIHPHLLNNVVDLTIYQYKLVAKAVKLFLHDRVVLSHFVRINNIEG